MPKLADLADETSGVIIEDPVVPPERPSNQPLEAPVVENAKPTKDTSSALDALAAPLLKKGDAPAPVADDSVEDPIAKAADEAAKKAAAKKATPKDTQKPADAAPPAKSPDDVVKSPEQIAAEEKAASDKAVADRIAAEKAAEPKDKLAAVALPPYVKPATVEAFNTVKRIAREEKAQLETRIKEIEAKIPKDGGLTPEAKAELEELRTFRRTYDLSGDVEFKTTYTKPIEANNEAILTKLETSGFSKDQIAQIKNIGLDKLDWAPILEKIGETNPVARRSIEAKLLDNENLTEKRAKALEAAKKAPEAFEAKRKEESKRAEAEQHALAEVTAKTILDQVPWFKVKDIPVSATAEERQALEESNKFVTEQQARYKDIMADRSPGMFGQLAASTLLAYQFKRDAELFKTRAEAAEQELAKIKKSSTRRVSAAPSDGNLPQRKSSIFKTDTGSALDALAAEKIRSNE